MPELSALLPSTTLPRRTWHYLRPPAHFEVAPCSCGNHDTQWSEFQSHLWCAECEKDFIPAHTGVFSGPIPRHAAMLLGMSFDRMNLETGQVERVDVETAQYGAIASTPPLDALVTGTKTGRWSDTEANESNVPKAE